MALSTKKKNIVLADAKAGRYGTIQDLCEHHRISRSTYYKLTRKACVVFGENSGIVEAGAIVEKAKKNTKNVHEINAINKAIEERTEVQKLDNELILNNRKLAKLIQSKIAENKDDINIDNARSATTALKDIESIANPKESKVEINNNNNNIQQTQIQIYIPDNKRA